MFEMPSLIELLRIGFMAPFDLPVHLRATGRYMFMRDAEIGKVPGELWSERRAVIGLDLLDREGEMLLDLPEEVDRGLGVVVVVDAEHAKSGRFFNGRELVEPLTSPSDGGTNFTSIWTERPGTCRGASAGFGPGRYFFCETGPT